MGRDVELFRGLGLSVDRVLCVGGGSRNQLWNQIKADVVGAPLELSDEPEAGIKGAALLGAAGAGLIGDPGEVARDRRTASKTVSPRPESSACYRIALEEFTRAYDHMLGYWKS